MFSGTLIHLHFKRYEKLACFNFKDVEKNKIILKNKKPYFKKLDVLVDTYSIQRQMPIPL